LLFLQNQPVEIKKLYQNISFLFILQIANYILPLVTFPYLVRTVGVEKIGLISLAQAFNQYFIVFTNFGFDFSATYDISVSRNSREKMSEIFNSVLLIKIALTVISFIILIIALLCINKLRDEWLLYIVTFGTVVGSAIFPVWFFQGVEKMKYVTVINMGTKILVAACIFIFIKTPDDFIYVPFLNTVGIIISALISIRFIARKFNFILYIPSFTIIRQTVHGSIEFFLSRIFASSYTSSNKIVIGMFLDSEHVGYYTMAEKIFQAWQSIYTPLSNSLYPFMAKNRNINLFKKIFWATIILNTMICIGIYIYSDVIIRIIYASEFTVAAQLLGLFAILSVLATPSLFLGYPLLAAMGHPKYANNSVVFGAIIHIILLFCIIPRLNVYMVVLLMVATNCIVVAIRLYALKKYKLT